MDLNKLNIKPVFWIAFGLIATFLAYLPVFHCDFTNWDDNLYITQNLLIRSFKPEYVIHWFTQPFQGLYQPLVLLSLASDYAINGLDPFVFHLTNLILHLLNTLLVYFFIRKLTGNRFMAVVVMLLFGLHPLHVESVAWVTERKDMLYAFFFLISLNFYLGYSKNRKPGQYIFTVLFFILSLLSKASAVTLPFVLILIDYYQQRKLTDRKVILEKLPFLVLAAGFGVANLIFHYQFGSLANYSNLSLPARFFLASKGLMYFLSKTVWPSDLSVYNSLPVAMNSELILECIFYILLLLISTFVLYKMNKRILIFGALFFILAIGLFLVPPGEPVIASERYSYIASIGLFIIIAHIFRELKDKKSGNLVGVLSVLAIYLGFLGARTLQQTQIWENSYTLWNHVINVRGETFLALLERGNLERQQGDYQAALKDYSRAIDLNPHYYKTYDRRGNLFLLLENYPAAITDFTKSLKMHPGGAFAHCSLGFTYRKTKDYPKALKHLEKALQIDPENADAYFNRGKIFLIQQKYTAACSDLEKALSFGLAEQNEIETVNLLKEYCN